MSRYPDNFRGLPGDDEDALFDSAIDRWEWLTLHDKQKIDVARAQFSIALKALDVGASTIAHLDAAAFVYEEKFDRFADESNFLDAVECLKDCLHAYGLADQQNKKDAVGKYFLVESLEDQGIELLINEERGILW
jgi:hypothetical protein